MIGCIYSLGTTSSKKNSGFILVRSSFGILKFCILGFGGGCYYYWWFDPLIILDSYPNARLSVTLLLSPMGDRGGSYAKNSLF